MKIFKINIFLWCIIFLVIAISFNEVSIRIKQKQEIQKGLDFAKENKDALIFVFFKLYQLNPETKAYEDLGLTETFGRMPQDIGVSDEKVVYRDVNSSDVKIHFWNNDSEIIAEGLHRFWGPACISNAGDKMACMTYVNPNDKRTTLVIYDFKTKDQRVYEDVNSANYFSWSPDDKTLFFSDPHEIIKLDTITGEQESVTRGFWPKVLPGNELAFWRGNNICYKLNLDTMTEREVFKSKRTLFGSDWDPSGRYLLMSCYTTTHFFLFVPKIVCQPFIYDTQSQITYTLPPIENPNQKGIKTGCIFWLDKNNTK